MPSVEERLTRLEHRVEELLARFEALPTAPPAAHSAPVPSPAAVRERAARWALRGEQWTGRVGLGLLFLGLVFLFQYSIEQGWITPLVRVLFGVALGGSFLGLGLRIEARRPSYSAILLAGAVASFYVTGWAAFQLYGLVGRPLALAWMAGVTLLALLLARRQSQPALATLGATGGFATPFLLGAGPDAVPEVVVHATLVVFWTAALYFARGWRPVLWTYAVGGLAVLAVAGTEAEGAERWLVQGAVFLTWTVGIALPFIREARGTGAANPHPDAKLPFALELRLLGVGGSVVALGITARMWRLDDPEAGVLFGAVALLYAVFAWVGTRTPNFVARAAAPVAAALCATATFLLLNEGPARWWIAGLEAALFVYGGSRPRLRGLEWAGHGVFALLAFALLREAFFGASAAFDALAWAQGGGVILGAAASVWVQPPRAVWVYRIAAHTLVLVWLAAEFGALADGTGWVTAAWGVYGGALLFFALVWGRERAVPALGLQAIAASALALTVGKLLVMDLAEVPALTRVLLFLGTGAALLALSALFQRPGRVPHDDTRVPNS